MNRAEFLNNGEVQEFIQWLVNAVSDIEICLNIPRSRFVPSPIRRNVQGLNAVLPLYRWRATGMQVGDWCETRRHLMDLANRLRQAVNDPASDLLAVIRSVLEWGGNRNWDVGAFPFLQEHNNAGSLRRYIEDVGRALHLTTADTTLVAPPVEKMNSMLTKVHALYAQDGLPIYDSRVAAAIATLVECWRVEHNIVRTPLPGLLVFPATLRNRTVKKRFQGALHMPPVLNYADPMMPAMWGSAKIRLGWIMQEVLSRCPELFPDDQEMPARMHAFEATLFMIGYDVACLQCNGVVGDNQRRTYAANFRGGITELDVTNARAIRPLSGRGKDINYSGSIEAGFSVRWGAKVRFDVDPEQIVEIQAEFGGCLDIPLGASRTDPTPGSLGEWLRANGWPSSSYATPIAAVLKDLEVITRTQGQKPILLSFA